MGKLYGIKNMHSGDWYPPCPPQNRYLRYNVPLVIFRTLFGAMLYVRDLEGGFDKWEPAEWEESDWGYEIKVDPGGDEFTYSKAAPVFFRGEDDTSPDEDWQVTWEHFEVVRYGFDAWDTRTIHFKQFRSKQRPKNREKLRKARTEKRKKWNKARRRKMMRELRKITSSDRFPAEKESLATMLKNKLSATTRKRLLVVRTIESHPENFIALNEYLRVANDEFLDRLLDDILGPEESPPRL